LTEDLQTLYLIPRSPSPIPLEDRPEGDLTREELLELLRRQKVEIHVSIKTQVHADSERFVKRNRSESNRSLKESASKMMKATMTWS
jgi:hypothetical protein